MHISSMQHAHIYHRLGRLFLSTHIYSYSVNTCLYRSSYMYISIYTYIYS